MILEKRLIKIDDIDLYSKLHIKEFYTPDTVISKNYTGVTGNILTYVKAKIAQPRTAYTFDSGWLSYANKEAILNLYNELNKIFNLYYTDGTVEKVRFDHIKGIKFTPIFEGAEYYTTTLNFITIPE